MKKLILFLTILMLLFTSCNLELMLGETPSFEEDYNPPREVVFSTAPPARPMATGAYYEDSIIVSWSAVEGADYYSLERAEFETIPTQTDAENAVWTAIYNNVDTNRYEDRDSSLRDGYYYAYRITAHTYVGMQAGQPSAICYGSLLSPPQSVTATKGTDTARITITWNQMPGIDRYYIYSSTNSDTVSIGEVVATVAQLDASEPNGVENSYSYLVPQANLGTTLYFAVGSSGGNGAVSASKSPTTSGYTRVLGAASTPEIESITKGDSTDRITLKWHRDTASTEDDPITYTVTRSSAGSSEMVIYPMYEGQELSYDEGSGCYYLEDASGIRENVEYTYSITAKNKTGLSQAAIATGYILSPPQSLAFTPSDGGYSLSATLPVGAVDTWKYKLSITKESGDVTEDEIDANELHAFFAEATATSSSDASYQEEIRKIEVWTVNGDTVSAGSTTATISGIPNTPSISASQNRRSLMSANANGVLPLEITLTSTSGYEAADYVITRGDGKVFTSTTSSYYDSDGTEAGKVYSYTAVARDALGRESGSTRVVEGYGAITGEKFIEIFEDFILKPWENGTLNPEYVSGSKSSVWGYISQAGMGSLGSASVTGSGLLGKPDATLKGQTGTLSYNATAQGIGGNVGFSYTRYMSEAAKYFDRDFYLAENASYNMIVSLSGSGSVSGGPFTVAGMYPAVVDFGRLAVSNNAFTGSYVVTQTHEGGVNVNYEVRM